MYVLDVIPIAHAVGRETLTYFTSEKVAPGMLVSIPLRSRTVPAIVTAVEDVRDAKSRIRLLEHELRPIKGLEAAHFLLPSFIAAASNIARRAAATTGSVIAELVPKRIIAHARKLTRRSPSTRRDLAHRAPRETPGSATLAAEEPLIVQAPEQDRFAVYRRLIRESFALRKSVIVLAPTVYLARRLTQTLAKGIEQYTLLIHGEIKPRSSLLAIWKRALAEPHPLLIVGTARTLGLARPDIAVYILEEEGSRHWKSAARPFLDMRTATEEVSRAARARCVLGSALLRTETLYRYESGEVQALVPPTLRPLSTARVALIDMARKKDAPPRERARAARRAILSEEARALLGESLAARERLLVFAARRALAPTTICGDCEHLVRCRRCESAVVLHTAPRRPVFRCHRCGEERDAHETCATCGGWKLVALGIGTENTAEAIRALLPNATLLRADSDTTPTGAKAEAVVREFLGSPGALLVSTEIALPYLTEDIEHIIVASLDALLALPDFRMNERVFDLLLTLRSRALKTFLIQTRNAEQHVFRHAATGHISDFVREELAERKHFGYPPFTTLIKISRTGERDALIKDMAQLRATLAAYAPVVYHAPTNTPRGKNEMHALIKIPRENWPDEALLRLLSVLPPAFAIDVNPASIL